jgi:hypothetical protein
MRNNIIQLVEKCASGSLLYAELSYATEFDWASTLKENLMLLEIM